MYLFLNVIESQKKRKTMTYDEIEFLNKEQTYARESKSKNVSIYLCVCDCIVIVRWGCARWFHLENETVAREREWERVGQI